MAFLTASLGLALLAFNFMFVSAGQRIITAEPGDNVILTCRAAENKDVIIVEWSRTDLESDQYVLVYRDKKFDPDFQPPSFRNRVSLLDMKNGDVSLVLKDFTTADRGTYECRVDYTQKNRRKRSLLGGDPISTFNLTVKPDQRNITAEPGDNVILTCQAVQNKPSIVVDWSRTDMETDQFVLLYSHNHFDSEGQSPSFINRVDLLDVKNGNMSLVLKNVTTDDTGTYECRVDYKRNNRSKRAVLDTDPISIINLRVEAGNKGGPEEGRGNEDGGSWTELILGVAGGLIGLFALLSVVGFLLYRKWRRSHQEQNPSPAAERVPMNPVQPSSS